MDQIDFYKAKLAYEIDSWDLSEALKSGGIVVVDARSEQAYRQAHIPGAINLPHRLMTAETTAELDKRKRYVSYCDGIGCNASTKGALKLAELGFDVLELLGGLDRWRRDGYATGGEQASEGAAVACGC